jgi:hypothetical protein
MIGADFANRFYSPHSSLHGIDIAACRGVTIRCGDAALIHGNWNSGTRNRSAVKLNS